MLTTVKKPWTSMESTKHTSCTVVRKCFNLRLVMITRRIVDSLPICQLDKKESYVTCWKTDSRPSKASWCVSFSSVRTACLWNNLKCTPIYSSCLYSPSLPVTTCSLRAWRTQTDRDTRSCSAASWSSRMWCHPSSPCSFLSQSTTQSSNSFKSRSSALNHGEFHSQARSTFAASIRQVL